MQTTIDPISPQLSVSVHASAGTGKTWLLVSRIVRLLLDGAEPGGILAVTFTRKAAAEMLERLNERLRSMAVASDAELEALLGQLGVCADGTVRARARLLYEQLLFCERPLRTSTFHSFCQEILQRFPLEAGVPPGFELCEQEADLLHQAWDALSADATALPQGPVAAALTTLFAATNGLYNTRAALSAFCAQRIDWWAMTTDQARPDDFASAALAEQLEIDPHADSVREFFNEARVAAFHEFAKLLGRHPTKTNLKYQDILYQALEQGTEESYRQRAAEVSAVFLTQAGEPRKRTASATQIKAMGEENSARFVQLHEHLCVELQALEERLARQRTWKHCAAWYTAGAAMLDHFQRIKREQRLLDFADLEWHAYRLLNHLDSAHWVQYKLDARIDHLLIDEFQDTNPTQWRLLLPLLEELAAGDPERCRSVFLVGDEKQSIYRFRRADPRLLGSAGNWLRQHLGAGRYALDASRRSAQAIMDCVNRVFAHPQLSCLFKDFPLHSTHLQELWGHVELLPLAEPEAVETDTESVATDAGPLRNPLREPRSVSEDQRRQHEARSVALRIRELIEQETLLGSADNARIARYGDVMILLRNRTHAHVYETALRDAGIPFLGAGRGTLLNHLEVRDIEMLLTSLATPFNNLQLAQVLKCPLFSAGDEDLLLLAQTRGENWFERLQTLATTLPEDHCLQRAHRLLTVWRTQVGQIPVHDLLDRIYFEGDVTARFESAFPAIMRPRVRANLTRFLELALEIDSGRYPSLPHFLDRLRTLRSQDQDAPDAAVTDEEDNARVRMLTVHGSKGLEAPILFIVDAAAAAQAGKAWQALVDWPAQSARPTFMLLAGRSAEQDAFTRAQLEMQAQAERREDANLLYVALTRARQYLFVSACVPARSRDKLGWYGLLQDQLGDAASIHSGHYPEQALPVQRLQLPPIDSTMAHPGKLPPADGEIAPSRYTDAYAGAASGDIDGRRRGLAIHRALDLLTRTPPVPMDQVRAELRRDQQRGPQDPQVDTWLEQAYAVVTDKKLAWLFDPVRSELAFNEVPLLCDWRGRVVHGVIDRVIYSDQEVHIIDYKTHTIESAAEYAELGERYSGQMHMYAHGARGVWPDARIRCWLLFTHTRSLFEIPLDAG